MQSVSEVHYVPVRSSADDNVCSSVRLALKLLHALPETEGDNLRLAVKINFTVVEEGATKSSTYVQVIIELRIHRHVSTGGLRFSTLGVSGCPYISVCLIEENHQGWTVRCKARSLPGFQLFLIVLQY